LISCFTMPPKQRRVDPEVLAAQFEQWKNSEEYKQWRDLLTLYKKFPALTETSYVVTGKWQTFHDELFKFVQTIKAKNRLKEFKHEWIRSFFFAQEDKEEENIIIKYDGIKCAADKQYADASYHLRHKFMEIIGFLEKIDDLTAENYQNEKKALVKAVNEFCKNLANFIKKGHKHIYEEKL